MRAPNVAALQCALALSQAPVADRAPWRWRIAPKVPGRPPAQPRPSVRKRPADTVAMYMADVRSRKAKLLTAEEERELARRVAQGDELAKQRFIEANMLLVISEAKKFRERAKSTSLSLSDLISDGNIGLVKAVERFDPNEGTRFSTYAVWWIRQAIRKSIMSVGRHIRLPAHMHEMLTRYRRTEAILTDRLERAPERHEVIGAMDVTAEQADMIRKALTRIESADSVGESHNSDEGGMARSLAGDSPMPEEQAAQSEMRAKLGPVMNKLSAREREIVCRYFGIECEAQTFKDIAADLGMTRDQVRQFHSRALARLSTMMPRPESA